MTLLQLLKNGGEIRINQMAGAPVIRRSSVQKRVLVAERPGQRQQFPLTRAGIDEALKWAANGYIARVERRH